MNEPTGQRKTPESKLGGSANESNTFQSGNDGQKGNLIPSADDLKRRVDKLLQLLTALSAELSRKGPFPL